MRQSQNDIQQIHDKNRCNRQNQARQFLRRCHHSFLLLTMLALLSLSIPPATATADGFPIIGTLHMGGKPEAVAVDTQTHLVYIGNEGPGEVVCFDPLSGTVRWRVKTGSITDLQVDSTRHVVYAFDNKSGGPGGLLALDGATGHEIDFISTHSGDNSLVVDTRTDTVFVLNRDDSTIFILTFPAHWPNYTAQSQALPEPPIVQLQTIGKNTPAGLHPSVPENAILLRQLKVQGQPIALGINSKLGHLYIADNNSHQLLVIDEKKTLSPPENTTPFTPLYTLASVPIGLGVVPPMRVDEKTARVFVLCSESQELDVIDGKIYKAIAHTAVGPYPEGLAVHTGTGRIYVTDEGSREYGGGGSVHGTTISVLDGQSYALLGTLNVGLEPDGVESDPGLHRVYVAAEDSGTLVEVSDSSNLPLQVDNSTINAVATQRAIQALQWTAIAIVIVMLATLIIATLVALSPRWRGQETLQTPPADASSRSNSHSLRP